MTNKIEVTNLEFGDHVILVYSTEQYGLRVLEAAALKFSDVAGFNIQPVDSTAKITISALSVTPTAGDIARHYANELIDQNLRAKIADQTAVERNLILSFAFSNTKFVG